MELFIDKPEDRLGKDYLDHQIFNQLDYYITFYDALSFSIMNFMSNGTIGLYNFDTYTYSSIKGTLESIKDVLKKARINDGYALLRKYDDSTLINIYSNLYLSDHFNLDNIIVSQIDNWRKGTETIPEYRVISKYIKDSPKLKHITNMLYQDDRYKKIRRRCNDHTHYNFYRNLLLNDNQIVNPDRINHLNQFSKDLESVFIQHFSCIFSLNDHYMMSSDYMDSMELNLTPEEGSQYWVADFIQKAFDEIIKVKRPDIAEEIKENTSMKLT